MTCWEVLDGVTLTPIARTDLSNSQELYGAPLHTVHRADLHRELARLASTHENKPAIQLAARVVYADAEKGFVDLEDGTRHFADLIIAGDGVHSELRSIVTGEEQPQQTTGMSAFRFMIPTVTLENNSHFIELLKVKGKGSTVFADTTQESERHLVWYDCQE